MGVKTFCLPAYYPRLGVEVPPAVCPDRPYTLSGEQEPDDGCMGYCLEPHLQFSTSLYKSLGAHIFE